MASTLFQAASAKGGSSSANPFLDLAHFYEQEMNDQYLDVRLSSATDSTWNAHPYHPSTAFRTPKETPHASSTCSEYSSFAALDSAPSWNPSSSTMTTPRPVSSPLSRRRWDLQDYAAEARKRSEDRHDGLGPIIDFSAPVIPSPTFVLDPPSSSSSSVSSTPPLPPSGLWMSEDHWMHHQNPYSATDQRALPHHHHHHPSHRSNMRANSQEEQVWMDMEQTFQQTMASSNPTGHHHHHQSRNKGKAVQSRQHPSSAQASVWEHTWQQQQHTSPPSSPSLTTIAAGTTTPSTTSSSTLSATPTPTLSAEAFFDMAARLPSEWPLPPWAIQTEAALLENEAMHRCPSHLNMHTTTATTDSAAPRISYGDTVERHPNRHKKEEYNDDLFEGDMLQAWISTLEQEKRDADRAKEAKTGSATDGDCQVAADPAVLNMALRRLHRLMDQLQISSAGGVAHPHFIAVAAAASSLQHDTSHCQ